MLDAYLFLLSQFVPHSEHSLFFLQKLSSASACTSHRTLSQLHGTNLARDRKRRQIVIQTVLLFLLDFHQSGKVKTNFSKKNQICTFREILWVGYALFRAVGPA